MIVIDNKYNLGEVLYLVTDRDQLKRIVTGIVYCPDNSILYEVINGTLASKHYDFELSRELDTIMKTTS